MSRPEHNGKAPIREDGRDFIEVHVAGVVLREHDGRWQVLGAKRTDKRSLFPGKWECGGGQVRTGEDFPSALRRQMFEEFGLKVLPWFIIEDYAIHVPDEQRTIPGLRYACVASGGKVRLNKREFTSFRWLDLPVPAVDWIPGIREMLNGLQLGEPSAPSSPSSANKKPPASKGKVGFVSDSRAG